METKPDASTEETFPFRFYGSQPADWLEGANDAHLYELCFCSPPDDGTLVELAGLFEERCATGPVNAASAPWGWSGCWAHLCVGERFDTGSEAVFFRAVQALFLAIHEVAPLEQVTFLGARAPSKDTWEPWSLLQRREPTPGPASSRVMRSVSYYGGTGDQSLAEPTANAAFEAARIAARERKQGVLAAGRRKKAGGRAEQAARSGAVHLAPIDEADLSEEATESPEIEKLRGILGDQGLVRVGKNAAISLESGVARVVTAEGHPAAVELPARGLGCRVCSVDLAPDGRSALLGVNVSSAFGQSASDCVCTVVLPETDARFAFEVSSTTEKIQAVAFAGRLAVAATSKRVLLFDPTTFDREPLSAVPSVAMSLAVFSEGRIVLGLGREKLVVLAVLDRALKRLAVLDARVWHAEERDGRMFVTGPDGRFELLNAVEAYESLSPKAPPRKKFPPATPSMQLRPCAVDSLPTADAPVAPDRYPTGTAVAIGASGRDAAISESIMVQWHDEAGELRSARLPHVGHHLDVSPDGSFAAVCTAGPAIVVISLLSGQTRLTHAIDWAEHRSLVGLAYVGEATLAVLTAKQLFLLDVSGDAGAVVDSLKLKCGGKVDEARYFMQLLLAHERQVVVVFAPNARGTDRLLVVGVSGSRLRILGKFENISSVDVRAQRVFVVDSRDQSLEVDGIREAYEQFAQEVNP